MSEDTKKAIDEECKRLRKMIPQNNVTPQGKDNMCAITGQVEQKICKMCGNPTDSSYKYCTRCFYIINRANQKRKKYY